AAEQCESGAGFGVFLLGVVQEAGVVDIGVAFERGDGGVAHGFGFVELAGGFVEVASVDGADAVGAHADDGSAGGERLLAGGVLGREVVQDARDDGFERRGVTHGGRLSNRKDAKDTKDACQPRSRSVYWNVPRRLGVRGASPETW